MFELTAALGEVKNRQNVEDALNYECAISKIKNF